MKSAQQTGSLHSSVMPTTVIDTQVVHLILTIEFMEDEDTVHSDEGGGMAPTMMSMALAPSEPAKNLPSSLTAAPLRSVKETWPYKAFIEVFFLDFAPGIRRGPKTRWILLRLESSLKFRGGEGKVLRGGYLGGMTPDPSQP